MLGMRGMLLALLMVGSAQAAVTDVTLDNGLRVIVQEDHRAPVMVSQVWYRAGSLDEFNGTTGVAHVLEHMMFRGTKTVPPGEFSKRIAAAGGRENAFTNRDHTAYFQQMQKDRLELAMQLESDRMANLVIRDDLFAKEMQVVMEERRLRTDDQPLSVVYERLMAWHAPSFKVREKDTSPYALQILAGVLSGNDSARLQKSLGKTQQIAVSTSAGYDAVSRGPGMFMIDT